MPQLMDNQEKDSQFSDWKRHPITQKLLENLHKNAEYVKNAWADGAYDHEEDSKARRLTSAALGKLAAIQELQDNITNGYFLEEEV